MWAQLMDGCTRARSNTEICFIAAKLVVIVDGWPRAQETTKSKMPSGCVISSWSSIAAYAFERPGHFDVASELYPLPTCYGCSPEAPYYPYFSEVS